MSPHKSSPDQLIKKLSIQNIDRVILLRALRHRSSSGVDNNELLEFLGDAVLKLIATSYLLEKYPQHREGELTRIRSVLISDNTLYDIAVSLELGELIELGYSEIRSGGRTKKTILANTVEALFGAIYSSLGLEKSIAIFKILFVPKIKDIEKQDTNYKAILQEALQARYKELPEYSLVDTVSFPDNTKLFTIQASFRGEAYGSGKADTKKSAEQLAAKESITRLRELGMID